jgi:hypothetical protein
VGSDFFWDPLAYGLKVGVKLAKFSAAIDLKDEAKEREAQGREGYDVSGGHQVLSFVDR